MHATAKYRTPRPTTDSRWAAPSDAIVDIARGHGALARGRGAQRVPAGDRELVRLARAAEADCLAVLPLIDAWTEGWDAACEDATATP